MLLQKTVNVASIKEHLVNEFDRNFKDKTIEELEEKG